MRNSKRIDCYGSSSSDPPPAAPRIPLPDTSSRGESSSSSTEQGRPIDNQNFMLNKLSNIFAKLYFSAQLHSNEQLIEEIRRNNIQIINNEDIIEKEKLGNDDVSEIWRGTYNGAPVCIKKIRRDSFAGYQNISYIQNTAIDPFWRDVNIMNVLHHKNIVNFLGVVLNDPDASMKCLTEKMPDSSYRHVWQQREFSKLEKLKIARDAAAGLEYMHSKGVMFYAFKSTNMILDLTDPSKPKCKIGDIGMFNFDLKINKPYLKLRSKMWEAPELISERINRNNGVTGKIDVFSFGIVLWELLTDKFPYEDIRDENFIMDGVLSNTLRPDIPQSCDLEWENLIRKCWDQNPKTRPSFTEIIKQLDLMCIPTRTRTPGFRKLNRGVFNQDLYG